MTNHIHDIYNRLLQDVHVKTGVSLDAPVEALDKWLRSEAPLVDKQILAYLEHYPDRKVDIPEWLKPLWDKFILTDDPTVLQCIRQLLLFTYKTEEEPNNEQLRDAEEAYEQTDEDVGCWSRAYSSAKSFNHTLHTARRIVGSIIYRINWAEIIPSHGPGGIYPSRLPSEKSCFRTLYTPIQRLYPYDQYFCGLPSFWESTLVRHTDAIKEEEHIVAKLCAVPKDSRGPRIICVHPAEAIWIQQGQRRLLEAAISTSPLTKGRINFTDQSVNGRLALLSSSSREFCTLDLKEASDRISCLLVRDLFGSHAYKWISCARASKIKLLSGRVITVKKWAPMGNALCFPVQSLIFFALVTAGIRAFYGINCRDVYVFGDDIIFPSSYYDGALRALVSSGLIPNPSKTFRHGFFRESCGVDAYKGAIVTPFRIKKGRIISLSDVVSNLELAKRMRLGGYEHCAAYLYKTCRSILHNRFGIYMPITNNVHCSGLVEYQCIPFTELLLRETLTYCKRYQRWDVRCRLVTGANIRVRNGDWYHLQDSLLRLERASRPIQVNTLDTSIITRQGIYHSTVLDESVVSWKHRNMFPEAIQSDRATEYAVPHRTRLISGWAGVLV